MKKIIFLLSLVLLFTGCNIERLDNKEIEDIISLALTKNNNLSNVNAKGYKYYIPRGMKIVNNDGYNTKIQYKDNTLYLYVDVVSYYHNVNKEHVKNDKSYYYRSLKVNDKLGYIEINKKDDKYFIEMMYNYAKIEGYINEEDLQYAMANSIYILASISYNDEILETLIGENILIYQEEQFNIFDTRQNDGNWLEYDKNYNGNKLPSHNIENEDAVLLNDYDQ